MPPSAPRPRRELIDAIKKQYPHLGNGTGSQKEPDVPMLPDAGRRELLGPLKEVTPEETNAVEKRAMIQLVRDCMESVRGTIRTCIEKTKSAGNAIGETVKENCGTIAASTVIAAIGITGFVIWSANDIVRMQRGETEKYKRAYEDTRENWEDTEEEVQRLQRRNDELHAEKEQREQYIQRMETWIRARQKKN